jgi:hypothetical protein
VSGFGLEFLDGVDLTPKRALDDVFKEEPVALDVFIKDSKYLNSDWSLSPIQTDLVQVIERIYLPDLYPQMAKEFGGYWKLTEHVPMKNLISAEWGKGCVSGDTEVYSPWDGQWRRIDSLDMSQQAHEFVAGTTQTGLHGDTNHEHGQPYDDAQNFLVGNLIGGEGPFVRGHGKMLRVTTRTGSVIDVYEGHLFASKRGVNSKALWTAAGALKGGNLIATPAMLWAGNPKDLSPEEFEQAVLDMQTGIVPESVYGLSSEQIGTLLERLRGSKTITYEVAVAMKRLYLRLYIVASIKEMPGEGWTVLPVSNQHVTQDGDIYWDMVDTIEDIGEADYWDMNVPHAGTYIANGIINSNSGKDHSVRVAALRVVYLLLCLKSPQKYFSMPEQDSIHMLNIAVNAAQAQRAFFNPLKSAVKKGWFSDKADPKRDSILFEHNIEAISGHSDAESQEGLNLILGVADEIDAFKSKGEMIGQGNKAREASTSAESILNMMKSSASTRFPSNYKRVAISYPRYIGSTIQKLTEEAKEDNRLYPNDSIYFASGPHATWEVNPRIRGKEDFTSDYRKDPVEAAAKYECKPFRSAAPYFRNPEIFTQSIDSETQPVEVDYALQTRISDITGQPVEGWEPVYHFAEDFYPRQGAAYAIHADLAIKGDRAGVAMSHVESWKSVTTVLPDEDGNLYNHEEMRPVVRNDFTISFSADIGSAPPREIQIRWVRELVFKLLNEGFHIASVTYDGYQSTDSMQILESHGIETDRVSTDRDPSIWRTLKDVASEGRLRMPYERLLLDELEALSESNGKVDHPPAGSKDLADAFACSVLGAVIAGGEESDDRAIVSSDETIFEVGLWNDLPLGLSGGGYQLPPGMRDY